MEATQKDQSCDARGEAVDSDEVNAGAQYDMPDDQESAELLRTIASMHSCAKYSLGELDAEERAASARHLDVLFLRAVDDLRMAVGQREIDAFKAGAAYTHRELAPILSEIAKAHVTLRGAIRIGKRTVKLAPIADVTKAFDALAATIASLRAALEVSK